MNQVFLIKIVGFILLIQSGTHAIGSTAKEKIDSLSVRLEQVESKEERLPILSLLGYEYWTVDANRSLEYGFEGLKLAVEQNNLQWIAFNYRVVGVAYWVLGDVALAMENLLSALDLYEKTADNLGIANSLMNLGLIYSEGIDYDISLKYFKEALDIYRLIGDKGREGTTLTKIASVYIDLKKYNNADSLLRISYGIHSESGFEYGLAETENRLGVIHMKVGLLDPSIFFLKSAENRSVVLSDNEGLAKNYIDLAEVYTLKGEFDTALDYYTKAVEVSEKINSMKWKAEAINGLYRMHRTKGELGMAYTFLEEFIQLQDSIASKDKINSMANLRNEFEQRENLRKLTEKQMEVDFLVLEADFRRKKFIAALLIAALGIIVMILLFIINKIREREIRIKKEKETQLIKTENELRRIELENARLREAELNQELEHKQRELTSYAFNFVQKSEWIQGLENDLAVLGKDNPQINKVKKKFSEVSRLDQDWGNFKMHFENVHKGFLEKLKSKVPELTQNELRHCILIKLNLNMKECASVLGISPESVKTSRYRLRKKMGLDKNENLFEFFSDLDRILN